MMTPTTGDEFHHFGWNACSSSLSPLSGRPWRGLDAGPHLSRDLRLIGTRRSVSEAGHAAAQTLMGNNLMTAFWVAVAHTFAMSLAGAVIAVFVYLWFGLKFISQSWFNLDRVWAVSLVLVGAFGIWSAINGQHSVLSDAA